MAHLMTCR